MARTKFIIVGIRRLDMLKHKYLEFLKMARLSNYWLI